jgi:glycosyltransferase involved in cell wall biosynthesis
MEHCNRQTIDDGHTGFLCSTAKEWEEKLEKLIVDAELRKQIGENAYNFVKEEWQYKDFDWSKLADEVLE